MSYAKRKRQLAIARAKRRKEAASKEGRAKAAKQRDIARQIEKRRYARKSKSIKGTQAGLPGEAFKEVVERKRDKTLTHKIGPPWRDH